MKVETVDGLLDALKHLQEQGYGDAPVYLACDEEWNGIHPLYNGGYPCADVFGPAESTFFNAPYGIVAIGTF